MSAGRLLVLGGGESGAWAAVLGVLQGWQVFLSDQGKLKDEYRDLLQQHGVNFEEGGHRLKGWALADIVVKSPGIPDDHTVVTTYSRQGIPVISEIEWAYKFCRGRILAVTGSNGKTTTTKLCHHLLVTGGVRAVLGGNIGRSFANLVLEEPDAEVFVLEISSFQLDGIAAFRPQLSILLNITPDHLDRYEYDLGLYAASKLRIQENQASADCFVYNAEDPGIAAGMASVRVKARSVPVSVSGFEGSGFADSAGHSYDLAGTCLTGRHNKLNAACATEAALFYGVSPKHIQEGLNTFVNDPHRLEKVAEVADVLYINDSKATNVDAVYYALEAMERPVVWIVGGQDKGNDYSVLDGLVRSRVKAIVCLGADNSKLLAHFGAMVGTISEARSAEEAVSQAVQAAVAGDTVLLSPACASFDLFRNYMHRGDAFKEAVETLKRGSEVS